MQLVRTDRADVEGLCDGEEQDYGLIPLEYGTLPETLVIGMAQVPLMALSPESCQWACTTRTRIRTC
jgi:hypothetical protein